MDADARIEAQQAEIDRLQERIDYLEAAMGMRFMAPLQWRLTAAETRVLGVLMAREVATQDAIMASLYRDAGRDEPAVKIVQVYICKIRAKLKPHDVQIETVWATGYRISPETKDRIRGMLPGSQAVAA